MALVHLGFERVRGLLPVGGVELLQIARNALLNLCLPSIHLGAGEVLVAVVHRLELAPVNRDACLRQQAHGAAEGDKPSADLPDGPTVVLAEVGNRLVIRSKAPGEPHHPRRSVQPHAPAGGSTEPG